MPSAGPSTTGSVASRLSGSTSSSSDPLLLVEGLRAVGLVGRGKNSQNRLIDKIDKIDKIEYQ